MPYYYGIRRMPKRRATRTLQGLTRLRAQLDAAMPVKTRDRTLVLGTWNLRNFDDNRFQNGPRTDEDKYYIAEILSRFDVIAIQEICNDLGPLDDVMRLLGGDFDYVVTDVTEGPGGNGERLGFVFDSRKVHFRGIAGELVLPDNLLIKDDERRLQFSRTPFMCSFRSGWFKFMFSTVHIYFGSSSGSKYRRRVAEVDAVAKFLKKRAKDDDDNHVLVGDFNIIEPGSDGSNALAENGFTVFQNRSGSNALQTKFYDQISFRVRENELRLTGTEREKGVLQFFDSVFRPEDFASFRQELVAAVEAKIKALEADITDLQGKIARSRSATSIARHGKAIADAQASIAEWQASLADDDKLRAYYLDDWRTFHASDHLPLWVELEIDFSGEYLDRLSAR